jgi:hypothetical protein
MLGGVRAAPRPPPAWMSERTLWPRWHPRQKRYRIIDIAGKDMQPKFAIFADRRLAIGKIGRKK